MKTNEVEPEVLSGLRMVLCRTSHAGNIGGAARALKVMGLSDLALVTPREFPSPEATARATGAADLLDRARVVETLNEAVADCVWVVGFTARDRVEGAPVVDVEDAAAEALAWAPRGRVAFVFGNERTGLENTEIVTCNALARIPTGSAHSSLNLAAAVQVACYEVRRQALQRRGVSALDETGDDAALASRQDLTALFDRVWGEVSANRRYRAEDKRVALLRARFEQLMVRAQPRRAEIRAAHGVLSWLAGIRDE